LETFIYHKRHKEYTKGLKKDRKQPSYFLNISYLCELRVENEKATQWLHYAYNRRCSVAKPTDNSTLKLALHRARLSAVL